jgi:hypothetical protein
MIDQETVMLPSSSLRRIEIQQVDGTWLEALMAQIQKGDRFRLFEPDGKPVTFKNCSVFEASDTCYVEVIADCVDDAGQIVPTP